MFCSFRYLVRNLQKQRCFCTTNYDTKCRTAGILVIGDEILKGSVLDTNSFYVTKKLYKLGIYVKKITVIGDSVDQISEEVKLFSNKYSYVITTGGIGPTHDDVTFEAVAKAFNEPLVHNPTLVQICSDFYQTNDLNSPGMKLAHIPQSSKLTFGEDPNLGKTAKFPIINVKNVFVLPGIPELLEKSFDRLGKLFFQSSHCFYKKEIYFNQTETEIVSVLNAVVKKYPNVVFGSYPQLHHNQYKVKVTIESLEENLTQKAYEELINMIPSHFIVDIIK